MPQVPFVPVHMAEAAGGGNAGGASDTATSRTPASSTRAATARADVDTLMDEEMSEDSQESDVSSLFDMEDGEEEERWQVDPESTRELTEAERNAKPTSAPTLGMQRYFNTILSIERRAKALEETRKRKQSARRRAAAK